MSPFPMKETSELANSVAFRVRSKLPFIRITM